MASTIGELSLAIRAGMATLKADLAREAPRIGDEAGNTIGARIKSRLSAANVGTALGAAFGTMGIGALKVADQYDDAMDRIRIGTGATGDALRGLEKDFQAVAGRVPDDLGIVGQTLADLNTRTGQTGQGLQDLTKQILDLSRITGTDAATNVANLTRLYGDWSIATEDQAAVNDKLFRTSQATGISVDQLSQKVVAFGAPMRALGLSFEESIALLGKWEKEGVNIETILSGMRMAVANFAKQGIDPREGLPALIEQIENADDATGLLAAKQVVGQRAANDFFRAIKEGRFDVEDLMGAIEDGSDTIATATSETEGFSEAFRKIKNAVAAAAGPIVRDLAGIGTELGNMVFLLPALGGALGRGLGALWTKLGGGTAVKAAVSAAGAAAGLIYQTAATAVGKFTQLLSAMWSAAGARVSGVAAMGGRAGAMFGTAFKVAAVAAVALLWVEVWNQFNAFNEKVSEAQTKLSEQTAAQIHKNGRAAIQERDQLASHLSQMGGLDRVLGDTFGGEQIAEGLLNTAKAIGSATDLTAEEVERAGDVLERAASEAAARGNDAVAAEIRGIAATVKVGVQEVEEAAEGIQAAYDPLSSAPPPIEPPDIAGPIADEFRAAQKAIADGFGSVKQALANPPAMISKDDRLANMEKRMRKVMRNINKAVREEDPIAVDYWTRAAAQQQRRMDTMKHTSNRSIESIRSTLEAAGVDMTGTFGRIGNSAKGAKGKVDNLDQSVEELPAKKDTKVNAKVTGEEKVEELRSDLNALPSQVSTTVSAVVRTVRHMQHGGRVEPRQAYIVGEVRPELFVPDVPGRIEPRVSGASVRSVQNESGGPVISAEVYGLPMHADTPREVVQQLRRAARLGYFGPPSRRREFAET